MSPATSLTFFFFTGRGAPRGRGAPGGRGGGRGGKAGLGRKGPGAVTLEPHKHEGVYIAKGKEHLLVTRNMTPGESVYGEKRISIATTNADGEEEKVEYRVWNPFRSKLAAGILGGLDNIHVSCIFIFFLRWWSYDPFGLTPYHSQIKPGAKVLYLGAASGSSVSHVSDIVGPDGVVYAVEFSHRPGRELIGMAKKRTNVVRKSSFLLFPYPTINLLLTYPPANE